MTTHKKTRCKLFAIALSVTAIALAFIMGPAASMLQIPAEQAIGPITESVDAVYLVCGARAQNRRINTLKYWLEQHGDAKQEIWIGNDTQNSLWSRKHQRNLTRAEWAHEYIRTFLPDSATCILVPGAFSNTDGEMLALAQYLESRPDMKTICLVTSGFHARRTWKRFNQYAPAQVQALVIPVRGHWENRAPWIVVMEWAKMLRDKLQLTQHPWLSRQ